MRFVTTAATATAVATGALLIALPAAGAASAATPSSPAPGSVCATQANFQKVHNGQSVAQVEQEMGSVGSTQGPSVGHGPGTRDFEETWQDCSLLGLPIKGAIQFEVDFQADAGKPLTVTGKTALPPTTVPGLSGVSVG